jgi:hypothetical protein
MDSASTALRLSTRAVGFLEVAAFANLEIAAIEIEHT